MVIGGAEDVQHQLQGCGTVRLKLFPSQFLETQRVKVREKESRQGQYWTALLPYSTFPASNTTHSHPSVQLNTSRTDSSALTHIYNEKCDWKPAKQSVFETHFICTSPFCMWGLEKSALECPKTVMSEFRFLTFLTLPGCLLPTISASCVFNIFWRDFTRKDKAGRNPYRIGQELLGNIETLGK